MMDISIVTGFIRIYFVSYCSGFAVHSNMMHTYNIFLTIESFGDSMIMN